MTRFSISLAASLALIAADPLVAQDRPTVDASEPTNVAITVYRDPQRELGDRLNRSDPRGFAMISETRRVTLPAGSSTIRFTGIAEGMVAVSAIVTGLPGGTIEKNRNAELLSPAALVNGMLGNRVTITRTDPATGQKESERAIVRTRADGGLVLESARGFEAVRCSGLPEKLTFDRVPDGLSAEPVFNIDTRDDSGGTYDVTLTYLAWGFDWQANYVATLQPETPVRRGKTGKRTMRLMSWLTVLNDNGQSFPDAELLAVAGTLNVTSDYEALADAPDAPPLQLTCYPFGSTAAGSPVVYPAPPAPPPPAPMMAPWSVGLESAQAITVTGSRMKSAPAIVAEEEALGDLRLYRVPERMTVSAQGLKQVAFLDRQNVEVDVFYRSACYPWDADGEPRSAGMMLRTQNDVKRGLGQALPSGGLAMFQRMADGSDLLLADTDLRDYAMGQDVEADLIASAQVHVACAYTSDGGFDGESRRWSPMAATITNANNRAVIVQLKLGSPVQFDLRGKRRKAPVDDGEYTMELRVPAGGTQTVEWELRGK